jgi:subtilisin family serine protease
MGFDSDIIACIEFARTNGAKVINASLGAYAYSQSLSNAIFDARQAGIIFVAACGNDGRDIDATPYYPASYNLDNIVSVGFTTRNDALDSRSNYGAGNVDLMAPGAAMYSTFFAADNSYLGGNFLYGSSLAAPYVAGAVALTLAKYPGETHQQTIQRVLLGADRLPTLAGKCGTGGRLNVKNALRPPIYVSPLAGAGVSPFQIRVTSVPNRSCVVEASPDLANWSAVYTNATGIDGTFVYTDNDSAGASRRYYRAVSAQ